MAYPNTWAECLPDGLVSYKVLQNAVNTNVLRLKPGQSIPVDPLPDKPTWARADEVLAWLQVTLNVSVTNNRFVAKKWIVPNREKMWVGDQPDCLTTQTITLDKTISGLMTPGSIYYDQESGRYYGVDADHSPNNLFWFDPVTVNTSSDVTYVTLPAHTGMVRVSAYDPENRRMWIAGDQTSGVYVVDLATHGVTTLPAGNNAQYSRMFLKIFGDFVYIGNTPTNKIFIYNRHTMALVQEKLISTITNGHIYLTNSYSVIQVNNELWVGANERFNGDIGRYSLDFTYLGQITIAGIAKPTGAWTQSFYWQSHYFDTQKNRYYVWDTGSNTLYCINGTSGTVISSAWLTERAGKQWGSCNVTLDRITGELLWVCRGMTDPADGNKKEWYYLINRDNLYITGMNVGTAPASLVARVGTTENWAVNQGNTSEQGGSWATDGFLYRFQANSGTEFTQYQQFLRLKEVYVDDGSPTGLTKPNDPEDPDYKPPVYNPAGCPITVNTACPTDDKVKLSPTQVNGTQQLEWEILFPQAILRNPVINRIEISADPTNPGSGGAAPPRIYAAPFQFDSYFKGIIEDPLTGRWSNYNSGVGGLNFLVVYKDINGNVLSSCGPRVVSPRGLYPGRPNFVP